LNRWEENFANYWRTAWRTVAIGRFTQQHNTKPYISRSSIPEDCN